MRRASIQHARAYAERGRRMVVGGTYAGSEMFGMGDSPYVTQEMFGTAGLFDWAKDVGTSISNIFTGSTAQQGTVIEPAINEEGIINTLTDWTKNLTELGADAMQFITAGNQLLEQRDIVAGAIDAGKAKVEEIKAASVAQGTPSPTDAQAAAIVAAYKTAAENQTGTKKPAVGGAVVIGAVALGGILLFTMMGRKGRRR